MLEKKWKLPISDLFMVGRRNLPKLSRLGITTIGELAKTLDNIKEKYGYEKISKAGELNIKQVN